MNKHAGATALAAVLLLAGCGSSGDDRADTIEAPEPAASAPASTPAPATTGSGSASTAPSVAPPALGDAQLKKALLTVSEMPTGFTLNKDDQDDSDEAGNDPCAKKFDKVGDDLKKRKVGDAERHFTKGSFGPLVEQDLVSFEEEDDAKAAIDVVSDLLNECQSFTSLDGAGAKTTFELAAMSFPKVGDETFAVAISGESDGVSLAAHMVVTRVDQSLQLVVLAGLTADADETEAIVRAGAKKLDKTV
jgi:hypothetical protein